MPDDDGAPGGLLRRMWAWLASEHPVSYAAAQQAGLPAKEIVDMTGQTREDLIRFFVETIVSVEGRSWQEAKIDRAYALALIAEVAQAVDGKAPAPAVDGKAPAVASAPKPAMMEPARRY